MKTFRQFNESLDESLLTKIKNVVSNKPKESPFDKMKPLTKGQRDHISKHFTNSNANIKFGGPDSDYVLSHNAHASHNNTRVSFRNENGKLKASVGHYANKRDASDKNVSPMIHTDHNAESDSDMEEIKKFGQRQ